MTVFLTTLRKAAFAMFAIAAAFFVVTAGAGAANASGVYTEIKFAPNTDNATVEGYLYPSTSDIYKLEARAGQLMTLSLYSGSGNARFTVSTPDGNAICVDNTWSEIRLPQSGRYHVTVNTLTRGEAYYWLGVTIR